jgi:hypothetical protein
MSARSAYFDRVRIQTPYRCIEIRLRKGADITSVYNLLLDEVRIIQCPQCQRKVLYADAIVDKDGNLEACCLCFEDKKA